MTNSKLNYALIINLSNTDFDSNNNGFFGTKR